MNAGLITIQSVRTVTQTLDRLAALLTQRSVHIFARIDHAAGARANNLSLRPTELLIFGNPAAGTPLM